jgi:exodeoxyribonuclease III
MAQRSTGISVLRETRGWTQPSDHVPVIARFKL